MIHYFKTDDLKMAVDSDYILGVSDDESDGNADEGVLDWARQMSEVYVKSRVAVRYDVTQWDVDADNDGISDNIDGVLVDCALAIAVYKLASRREGYAIPETIEKAYQIAEMKLERIANGTMILNATTSGSDQRIAANMTKDDLGQFTEDGDPLPWSEIL